MARPLPRSFYARETLEVAIDLLGKWIRHGPVTLRITEVEAYRHPGDSANHCRFGRTLRNAPMWGPPGHAYVYLCYGIHQMLNLVTDRDGAGAAVLVRACEPVDGLAEIAARRGDRLGPPSLTGPGKVARALAIEPRFSGAPLYLSTGLSVLDAPSVRDVVVGPRVGVDYAEPMHRIAPWRVAIAGSPWVSKPRTLQPLVPDVATFLASQRLVDAPSACAAPDRAPISRRVRPTRRS